MGLSIHYSGKLNDPVQIHEFQKEMINLSEAMDWKHTLLDEDWAKSNTARPGQSDNEHNTNINGCLPLKGILINLHPNSEPVSFLFRSDGVLVSLMSMIDTQKPPNDTEKIWVTTKTHYAGAQVHIATVKLLQFVKQKYIGNLEIIDEGGYLDSGDQKELQRRIDRINNVLNVIEERVKHIEINDDNSENIANALEEMLKKLFREDKY